MPNTNSVQHTTKASQIKCDWCERVVSRQEELIYVEEVDANLCSKCYWQCAPENTERTELS